MKSVHGDEQEIVNRLHNENDVAASMCLPLVMNGVDIGVALVDQGASRSVMRRSAFDRVKKSMRTIPYFYTVRNMFVVGSTNEHIPVIGCFKADLYTHDKKFVSETLIYVADDTEKKDIVCDLVLGRSSIGTSSYSCIDTQGTGTLIATERGVIDRIPCYRCQFVKDADGKSQLKMTVDPTGLQEHEHPYDCHDVGAQMKKPHSDGQEFVTTADNVYICHLMSKLGKTLPSSKEEKNVISELFAAFVPTIVKKTTTVAQEKLALGLAHSEHATEKVDEEEVDDIEFPLVPRDVR
jgi:hypothetical protein